MSKTQVAQEVMEDNYKKTSSQIFELRREMQKIGDKKKSIINTIRRNNFEAERFKRARDKLNAQVKGKKNERTDVNTEIKKLFSEYNKIKGNFPQNNFRRLEKEIEQLEWRQQTTVLKMDKEDELVKKLEELKNQMKDYSEIAAISKKIDKAKAKSEKIHKKILEISENSQQHHEKFLAAVKNIRDQESKIDILNKERNDVVTKLNGLTEAANILSHTIKEKQKKIKKATIKKRVKETKEVEVELKKKAEFTYQRFKNGEKLGTDDIYLLQRFNLF